MLAGGMSLEVSRLSVVSATRKVSALFGQVRVGVGLGHKSGQDCKHAKLLHVLSKCATLHADPFVCSLFSRTTTKLCGAGCSASALAPGVRPAWA